MRRAIGTLIVLLFFAGMKKMDGQGRFQCYFGGDKDDRMNLNAFSQPLAIKPDGSFMCLGYTDGFNHPKGQIMLSEIGPEGNLQWSKTYGGNALDYGHSISRLGKGYLISGASKSFSNAYRDGYLLKVDSLGNLQWSKAFTGNQSLGFATQAKMTSDGGILVLGITESEQGRKRAIHVLKLDTNQRVEWERIIGTEQNNYYGLDFEEVSNGYIIAGRREITKGRVIKLNHDGTVAWINQYDHPSFDIQFNDIERHEQALYLFGTVNTGNNDEALIVNLDLNGNIKWGKSYGGQEQENEISGSVKENGQLLIYGTTYSYGTGKGDFYLVKTGNDGEFITAKAYGVSGDDIMAQGKLVKDGGHALYGYSNDHPIGDTNNANLYLVKTDTSLASGCQEEKARANVKDLTLVKASMPDSSFTYSSNFNNAATQVGQPSAKYGEYCSECVYQPKAAFDYTVTATNQVDFTNESEFGFSYKWTFGDGDTSFQPNPTHTFAGNNAYEVCLAVSNACGKDSVCQKLVPTTGITEPEQNFISMYPNPTGDYLSIKVNETPKERSARVTIVDMRGKRVYTGLIADGKKRLNTSQWEAGVYMVEVITSDKAYKRKLLIR